ncbi:MAG: hypothetical protein ACYDAG_03715 [Chloroflexota bacterium]
MYELVGNLTPADQRTHQRTRFAVPEGCRELRLRFSYEPKACQAEEAAGLARRALDDQRDRLAGRLGAGVRHLAQAWALGYERWLFGPTGGRPFGLTPNMLTLSLDDAAGRYRGAAHRQDPEQDIRLSEAAATPGFLPGALPAGDWTLTLSVHGLVTPGCRYAIHIGAVTA